MDNVNKKPYKIGGKYPHFVELYNMTPNEFKKLDVSVIDYYVNSSKLKNIRGLFFYLPDELLNSLTIQHLKVISDSQIAKLPLKTLEILSKRYESDKQEYERLLKAFQIKSNKYKLDRSKTIKTVRETELYEYTNYISQKDVLSRLCLFKYLGPQNTNETIYIKNFLEIISPFEVTSKNNQLYPIIKQKFKLSVYNYDEIKRFISQCFQEDEKKREFDAIPYFYGFSEIFMRLLVEGYMSTGDMLLNKKVYDFLRNSHFPSLNIQLKKNSYIERFLYDEIKEYIEEFIEINKDLSHYKNYRGIEGIKKQRKYNSLGYSNNILFNVEGIKSGEIVF